MLEHKYLPGMRSPDQPPSLPAHQNLFPGHVSANSSVCSQATTALVNTSSNPGGACSILNASSSTHSSNNFYQNTMQSDASSLHKRKSVISSQSTGSSNDVSRILLKQNCTIVTILLVYLQQAPLTFTQQLQRQTKLNSRNNPFVQNAQVGALHGTGPSTSQAAGAHKSHNSQRHSQMLADLNEHNMGE